MPAPFSSLIYNTFIRRNSVFLGVIFGSAFAFEMVFDNAFDKAWDTMNRGRQWKDIRQHYTEGDNE